MQACDGKKITVDGEEYVLARSVPKLSGDVVLVRTYSAGVHVGRLVRRDGMEVVLGEACRVWRWGGANTLNELSQRGGDKTTRISEPVPEIVLTEAIEVIRCSEAAARALRTPAWP